MAISIVSGPCKHHRVKDTEEQSQSPHSVEEAERMRPGTSYTLQECTSSYLRLCPTSQSSYSHQKQFHLLRNKHSLCEHIHFIHRAKWTHPIGEGRQKSWMWLQMAVQQLHPSAKSTPSLHCSENQWGNLNKILKTVSDDGKTLGTLQQSKQCP